jgi:hypothetical protein
MRQQITLLVHCATLHRYADHSATNAVSSAGTPLTMRSSGVAAAFDEFVEQRAPVGFACAGHILHGEKPMEKYIAVPIASAISQARLFCSGVAHQMVFFRSPTSVSL